MNDFHYRIKTVDQLAISILKVFEFLGFIFENLKDIVGSLVGLKLANKGVLDRVDSDLLRIVGEGCIEDVLEGRRRHFRTDFQRDIGLFSGGSTGWARKHSQGISFYIISYHE